MAGRRTFRILTSSQQSGTSAETKFRISVKWTSPFKSEGASVQSTTGSRGVRISGSNAGYAMFRSSLKSTGYPLHSPVSASLPLPTSPCAITFQLDSEERAVWVSETVYVFRSRESSCTYRNSNAGSSSPSSRNSDNATTLILFLVGLKMAGYSRNM